MANRAFRVQVVLVFLVILLATSLVFMAGCGRPDVVGVYQWSKVEQLTLELKANGNYEEKYNAISPGPEVPATIGTWRIEGNKVITVINPDRETYGVDIPPSEYEIEGANLYDPKDGTRWYKK